MDTYRTRCAWHDIICLFLGIAALSSAASGASYSTNFPKTETPLLDGGHWIHGKAVGVDWANVVTTPGLAFGTQTGVEGGGPTEYNDSTAVLSGAWGANQTATATVHIKKQTDAAGVFEEVELRLRTTITAHSITGYEINFSCSANPTNFYAQIVRWNGPLGSFTFLNAIKYHIHDGDVVSATASGNTISVTVNGALIMSAVDSAFSGGSPGIGFYLRGVTGADPNFGFSSFTATDRQAGKPRLSITALGPSTAKDGTDVSLQTSGTMH